MVARKSPLPVNTGPWLTRQEAADRLRCDIRTLDTYHRQGRLRKYTVKGIQSVRYRVEDIDALLVAVPVPSDDAFSEDIGDGPGVWDE